MLLRLRENLALKIISLVASILLWLYVAQVERPPLVKAPVLAHVTVKNWPPGVDIKNIPKEMPVTLIGSQSQLQQIKEGDVQAILDLRTIQGDRSGPITARVVVRLSEHAHSLGVIFEAPPPFTVLVNPQQQSQMGVTLTYPKEPPAGFHYGRPAITPRSVTVNGLPDALSQVEHVVVHAAPPVHGANIDGDFRVQVVDSDGDPVSNVTVNPDKVHVRVELVEEPAAKIVTVSASLLDQPQPPYVLEAVSVKPNQVKITGRPERIAQIETMKTDDISVRQLTASQSMEVNLIIPPDVSVFDSSGQKITRVNVTVSLHKLNTPAPSPAPSPPPVSGDQTPKP